MTLVIDELWEGRTLRQNFRIKKSINLHCVRPWVYKHGIMGPMRVILSVFQGNRQLLTQEIQWTEINEQIPLTYAHGQLSFNFDSLQLNHDSGKEWTEYQIRMEVVGTPVNNPFFLGWIRRYELKIYDTYGDVDALGEAPNDMVEPYGFELFTYSR